jgi:hypothetical protein
MLKKKRYLAGLLMVQPTAFYDRSPWITPNPKGI